MLREGKARPKTLSRRRTGSSAPLTAASSLVRSNTNHAVQRRRHKERRSRRSQDSSVTAAARGNPIAQNRIADLYVSGRALPRDLAKAAAWNSFAKAAGLEDQDLDVATADLTLDERRRFTKLVHELGGF